MAISVLAALTLVVAPQRSGTYIQREQVSIDQFRSNPTASTGGGILPTFTTLRIDFPARLGLHSTEVIELVYARYIAASGDEFVMQDGEMKLVEGKPRPGKPISTLSRAVRVPLESSALSISPAAATAPEDAPLPHTFRWTVTPRQEGARHHALLDLSELISPSTDGSLFGTTEIKIGEQPAELRGGTQLILPFAVVDDRFILDQLLKILASLPALFGFIISYPLVVDWIKKRLRQSKKQSAGKPPATGAPGQPPTGQGSASGGSVEAAASASVPPRNEPSAPNTTAQP